MNFVKFNFNKKWSRREIMFLLEQLEMYLSAGLTVDEACEAIFGSLKSNRKSVLKSVQQKIQHGVSISKALDQHIRLSSSVYSLIYHGESSGTLAHAFGVAHKLMEREDELIKKCVSAMAYPVVIGVFAGLLTVGLLRGVMPQIVPMLKSLHVELPLLTRIVIDISEGFLVYGLYMGIGIVIVIILFNVFYKKSLKFKGGIHHLLIRTPLIGKMLISYHLSVFFGSVGALVESGLSASVSYSHVTQSVELLPLKQVLQTRCLNIDRGVSLGETLRHPLIPMYATALVSAGEKSGSLGISLTRAATIIDRDIEHSLKRMTALIEPVMMAGMGCMVGAIALSIMLPIYDISKVLQK